MSIVCDNCRKRPISEYYFRRGGGMYVCKTCKQRLIELEGEQDGQSVFNASSTEEKRHDA